MTLEDIKQRAGDEEWSYGLKLYNAKRARQLRAFSLFSEYIIDAKVSHFVKIMANGKIITDGDNNFNRYTVAALLQSSKDGVLKGLILANRNLASDTLFDSVALPLPAAEDIVLEITIDRYSNAPPAISFRTGIDRLYVVRNMEEFVNHVLHSKPMYFGKSFSYDPKINDYSKEHKELLQVIALYLDTMRNVDKPLTADETRRLSLKGELAPLVFARLENLSFLCSSKENMQHGIELSSLPAIFNVSGNEQSISITGVLPKDVQTLTEDGTYVFFDGKVRKIQAQDRKLFLTLYQNRSGRKAIFNFTKDKIPRVMGELLPSLMRSAPIHFDDRLNKSVIRLPFRSKIFLDKDGTAITATVSFQYGDINIDPFIINDGAPTLLLRDSEGEKSVMDALAKSGFKVRKGHAFIDKSDDVWNFLTEGVNLLTDVSQVFFSKDFKKLSVRKPKYTAYLKTGRQGLQLEMLDDGTPVEELIPLLEAIRLRRLYFRYKDGTMVSLEGSEKWQEFAEAYTDANRFSQGETQVKAYHAAYLNTLIKEKDLPVQSDSETIKRAAIRTEDIKSPVDGLYTYQKRGFEWLVSLWKLNMGGILADEMGLGKTPQMLSAISFVKKHSDPKKPCIVVAPTSLLFNWQSEAEKFTPDLTTAVLSGSRIKRAEIIAGFEKEMPDIIITSYPIIRRDADKIKHMDFAYAILDEAQYIKDPASLTARSVKLLNADCRVALSGTPMENNVGELWSLFDFVLPGYLPHYREFLRRYDEGKDAQDLRKRIRPFLMRRLKKDVMSELPPKIERTCFAGMESRQQKIYQAVLLQKKETMQELYDRRVLMKNGGEVLAAMTELRQICCHPSLVLPSFQGESGKLNLLMDLLPSLLENGHKVLLFSQFTRMLAIIKNKLDFLGIKSMYLDGNTPSMERLDMAESFNKGDCQLFLISLRAGGTGLNLTGADTVIHFDPWWNPTTEEQAIDRAHRVGQDKTVQVLRLVTKNSIEEKVVALGEHKRQLFDKLVTPGEVMPEKLSDKDILELFN
ncbi:MAG: DEAD/DEAH box helicase [Eubacteriales bacterium]|nr:DEAD/DEAH box helicase [Eubacteriales bacterium]